MRSPIRFRTVLTVLAVLALVLGAWVVVAILAGTAPQFATQAWESFRATTLTGSSPTGIDACGARSPDASTANTWSQRLMYCRRSATTQA